MMHVECWVYNDSGVVCLVAYILAVWCLLFICPSSLGLALTEYAEVPDRLKNGRSWQF